MLLIREDYEIVDGYSTPDREAYLESRGSFA